MFQKIAKDQRQIYTFFRLFDKAVYQFDLVMQYNDKYFYMKKQQLMEYDKQYFDRNFVPFDHKLAI
jgi:hypothetical protein